MKYAKALDTILECRDVLDSGLKLLNSDFAYIDETDSSILSDLDGNLYIGVADSLIKELARVVHLLDDLIKGGE